MLLKWILNLPTASVKKYNRIQCSSKITLANHLKKSIGIKKNKTVFKKIIKELTISHESQIQVEVLFKILFVNVIFLISDKWETDKVFSLIMKFLATVKDNFAQCSR